MQHTGGRGLGERLFCGVPVAAGCQHTGLGGLGERHLSGVSRLPGPVLHLRGVRASRRYVFRVQCYEGQLISI